MSKIDPKNADELLKVVSKKTECSGRYVKKAA